MGRKKGTGQPENLRPAPPEVQAKAVEAAREVFRLRRMWDEVAEKATSVEEAIEVLQAVAGAAKCGDIAAAKLYFDRVFGAVATKVVTEDEQGNTQPIGIVINVGNAPQKPAKVE